MPDWLHEAFVAGAQANGPPIFLVVFARCVAALVVGAGVAWIYAASRGRSLRSSATFGTTLVLLSALIALVTQVIGDNSARAFGLVGALSIVRFRSNVEDTRDTAFVIFAVVLGMAIGAGQAIVALVGLPTVGAAAWLLSALVRDHGRGAPLAGTLTVRCATGLDPALLSMETFAKHLLEHRLLGAATAGKGTAMEATFHVVLRRRSEAVALILELQRLEGMQSAELKPV